MYAFAGPTVLETADYQSSHHYFPPRVQWSQFQTYFLFKLEKVMDDFRASAPEQRGQANPNVESIPFEDMKERILKIVKGYNG